MPTPLTVAGLIAYLQTMPQDVLVVTQMYSCQMLLETKDIKLIQGCPPRPDGWVQDYRPDITPQQYVYFPGN